MKQFSRNTERQNGEYNHVFLNWRPLNVKRFYRNVRSILMIMQYVSYKKSRGSCLFYSVCLFLNKRPYFNTLFFPLWDFNQTRPERISPQSRLISTHTHTHTHTHIHGCTLARWQTHELWLCPTYCHLRDWHVFWTWRIVRWVCQRGAYGRSQRHSLKGPTQWWKTMWHTHFLNTPYKFMSYYIAFKQSYMFFKVLTIFRSKSTNVVAESGKRSIKRFKSDAKNVGW